jgi:thioredoxin 1
MSTKHLSDSEFETAIASSTPILVDFWAEWCGPCRQLGPIIDDLATEFEGKITIAKLNIEENPDAPQKYGVRGVPTMILFKDGKPVATKVGGMPKGALVEWLQSVA